MVRRFCLIGMAQAPQKNCPPTITASSRPEIVGNEWAITLCFSLFVHFLAKKEKPVTITVTGFGGDKRDRTADLLTASCYRFVILNVFASNTSVPSAKNAEFRKVLSAAPTRFRAHLGHNLGQGMRLPFNNSKVFIKNQY